MKFLGGWDQLRAAANKAGDAGGAPGDARRTSRAFNAGAERAVRAAAAAADELAAAVSGSRASVQIDALQRFMRRTSAPLHRPLARPTRSRARGGPATEGLREAHTES